MRLFGLGRRSAPTALLGRCLPSGPLNRACFSLSPAADRGVFVTAERALHLVDLDRDYSVPLAFPEGLPEREDRLTSASWAPGGPYLMVTRSYSGTRVYHTETGEQLWHRPEHLPNCWTPDGLGVVLNWRGPVERVAVHPGTFRPVENPGPEHTDFMDTHPFSDTHAYAAATGEDLGEFTPVSACFSPDCSRSFNGDIFELRQELDPASGHLLWVEGRKVAAPMWGQQFCGTELSAYSPDGAWLAVGGSDCPLPGLWRGPWLVSTQTNRVIYRAANPQTVPSSLAWSSDGTWVAADWRNVFRQHPQPDTVLGVYTPHPPHPEFRLQLPQARCAQSVAWVPGTHRVRAVVIRVGEGPLVHQVFRSERSWSEIWEWDLGDAARHLQPTARSSRARPLPLPEEVPEAPEAWLTPAAPTPPAERPGQRLRCFSATDSDARLSPDAANLVSNAGEGTLLVAHRDGTTPRPLVPPGRGMFRFHWAAQSEVLLAEDTDVGVVGFDVPSGRVLWRLPGHWGSSLAPDGRFLASTPNEGPAEEVATVVWDAPPTRVVRRFPQSQGLRWSPDGRWAVLYRVVHQPPSLQLAVLSTRNWKTVARVEARVQNVTVLAWSPDSTRFACAGYTNRTTGLPLLAGWIVDARTGKVLRQLEGPGPQSQAVAWSPEGRRVVFASPTSGPPEVPSGPEILVYDAQTGVCQEQLTGPTGEVTDLQWVPGQGLFALAHAGTLELWHWRDAPQ